jgi:alpha-D-ribose 1-methylphosphonate 5-triphosphate synthase subunit PhnH
MSIPPYTEAEARSRETFLALMWALSYPGRLYNLPEGGDSFSAIAEALLDLETSYYTPDEDLKSLLAQTGAQSLAVDQAAYHFYPSIVGDTLADIRQASIGTMLYPDEATTLFIGCTIGSGDSVALHGPGVNGQQEIQVGGVPETFWELREAACRFPLGWDVYFVDGLQIIGLPRSIRLERV